MSSIFIPGISGILGSANSFADFSPIWKNPLVEPFPKEFAPLWYVFIYNGLLTIPVILKSLVPLTVLILI